MSEINPRPLAKLLCKFVYKSPYGIGLGIPETMEMALRECGVPKMLFAAGISAVGKLLGFVLEFPGGATLHGIGEYGFGVNLFLALVGWLPGGDSE